MLLERPSGDDRLELRVALADGVSFTDIRYTAATMASLPSTAELLAWLSPSHVPLGRLGHLVNVATVAAAAERATLDRWPRSEARVWRATTASSGANLRRRRG